MAESNNNVMCPHCARTFNSEVLTRHLLICAQVKSPASTPAATFAVSDATITATAGEDTTPVEQESNSPVSTPAATFGVSDATITATAGEDTTPVEQEVTTAFGTLQVSDATIATATTGEDPVKEEARTRVITFECMEKKLAEITYKVYTKANLIANFPPQEVEDMANSVTPILHARAVTLIEDFLATKRASIYCTEQSYYADKTVVDVVTGIMQKRALVFYMPSDVYLLKSGTRGSGGFDRVGTDDEKNLHISDVMSYDELAISAIIDVAVPCHFVNSGGRRNAGRLGQPGTYEQTGVYYACIGARFEVDDQMEWQHMGVTDSHTTENGYGPRGAESGHHRAPLLAAWAKFYGVGDGAGHYYFPTLEEARADTSNRFIKIPSRVEKYLDAVVYRQRMKMTIEPFLLDANERARACGKRAYVHVVGLGLGCWQLLDAQGLLQLEAYGEILRTCSLPHIADIDFSWFPRDCTSIDGVGHEMLYTRDDNAVTLHFSKRDPAEKLVGENEGKLLVAMYAWDSGSYPGNEYWFGSLAASGDPAAAACSTIPFLQNPDINPRLSGEYALAWDANGHHSL